MAHSDATSTRKADHIDLALRAQVTDTDPRFYYEPVLHPHPTGLETPLRFLNKEMDAPIWVSSMTGGTAHAKSINENLAKACAKFKLGMGLGSCRIILDDDTYLKDFQVRKFCGDSVLLYANLGIAQVESLLQKKQEHKIRSLIDKTEADGLIVHINPLQEWMQPEGDHIAHPPQETLTELLERTDIPVIVKEVGQGMGPVSLKKLMQLPLAAIDFGAHGGTNFAMIEMLRGNQMHKEVYEPVVHLGHTAIEMVGFVNEILAEDDTIRCKNFIVSGGIKNFLDGYYLINALKAKAVYGQASAFLSHARKDYDQLCEYIIMQMRGLAMANAFLKVR